mmetsp:Transcript_77933/g.215432  ORF Transcript_77933/g.215432 Transcript_77933/m.215432 type:complete len:213 (+) Transcript_77933:766-1404(+)
MSTWPRTNHVLGSWPIATKAASTASVLASPCSSRASRSSSVVSALCCSPSASRVFPTNFTTSVFHLTWMLGLARTLCCNTRLARKLSRLWIITTSEQMRDSMSASSIAVSPPPITAQDLSLKRYPSQAAQLETPCPRYSHSPSTFSQRLSAPVARITVCDLTTPLLFVMISNGRVLAFTESTVSSQTSVKKLRAWCFMTSIIFPPFSRGMPG